MYKVRIRIGMSELRNYCIKNQFMDNSTNEIYEKFLMKTKNKLTLEELKNMAQIIYFFSTEFKEDLDHKYNVLITADDIMEDMLNEICYLTVIDE